MFIVNCLQDNADEDVRMILCGNKCDLSDAQAISEESGQSLAEEYGMKFMETSAKAGINVEEVLINRVVICLWCYTIIMQP